MGAIAGISGSTRLVCGGIGTEQESENAALCRGHVHAAVTAGKKLSFRLTTARSANWLPQTVYVDFVIENRLFGDRGHDDAFKLALAKALRKMMLEKLAS